MPSAGPTAMASAFTMPYNPMPAPIWRIGSSSDTHVARHTEPQAKPSPLTMRAAMSMPVESAQQYRIPATMYSVVPVATSSRLLTRSDRLPAIGLQNNDTKLITPAMTPISAPVAPRVSPYPATIGVMVILLAMKKKVASMTSATSRVMSRSFGALPGDLPLP